MSGDPRCVLSVADMREVIDDARSKGRSVGLVPTMGALHEGHLSLIRCARSQNDLVVVSVFVNPTQFGIGGDFEEYPRDLQGDLRAAGSAGADLVFSPSTEEMYCDDHSTWVEVEGLTSGLCGASRPGHFRGVCTVVAKLLAVCSPDRAYFGEKDAQQLAVIKRMVRDLNMRVEIIGCSTVREADGLAMSSRNQLLSAEERRQAPRLYESLCAAIAAIETGERSVPVLEGLIREVLEQASLGNIDYVQIVEAEGLTPVDCVGGTCIVALAVRFGSVRLIDNVRVSV